MFSSLNIFGQPPTFADPDPDPDPDHDQLFGKRKRIDETMATENNFLVQPKTKTKFLFGEPAYDFGEGPRFVQSDDHPIFGKRREEKTATESNLISEPTFGLVDSDPRFRLLDDDPDMGPFAKRSEEMTKKIPRRRSGGFDGFGSKFLSVGVLKEGDETYNTLCRYSSLAIEKYNSDNDTNYKFFKYVHSTWMACAGCKDYITFEAKEDGDESPTTFNALVYTGIPIGEDENIQVLLVMKKGAPTLEDEKILSAYCC